MTTLMGITLPRDLKTGVNTNFREIGRDRECCAIPPVTMNSKLETGTSIWVVFHT